MMNDDQELEAQQLLLRLYKPRATAMQILRQTGKAFSRICERV